MTQRFNYLFSILFIFLIFNLSAQIEKYNYKRALKGISSDWHKINLPDNIYSKVNPNYNDIRIYGVSAGNDTIEAPYVFQTSEGTLKDESIAFKLLNQTSNASGYFYTFQISEDVSINEIVLNFDQKNFDWKLKLEGGNDQSQWFTITDNYRIVAINNALTDYTFSTINFPDVKYRYFRLQVIANEKPNLVEPKINRTVSANGQYKRYTVKLLKNDLVAKQSIIEVALQDKVPVSFVQFKIKNKYDYYRPFTIAYLIDSTQTQKGWIRNYAELASGTLSSLEKNNIVVENVLAKQFRITIENSDNEALQIDSIIVQGAIQNIMARFDKKADYYLVYGNNMADAAHYDIENFSNKIPTEATALELGSEELIPHAAAKPAEALFKNKYWLWGIMGLIIVLLGGFSLRMMKKQ
jgi:Protein of unknown function (DUF3999)